MVVFYPVESVDGYLSRERTSGWNTKAILIVTCDALNEQNAIPRRVYVLIALLLTSRTAKCFTAWQIEVVI